MIEIYGKPQCPYCDKAKSLCEREGYEYTYKTLDEDYTREDLMDLFPTARTFPQIIAEGDKPKSDENFFKEIIGEKTVDED